MFIRELVPNSLICLYSDAGSYKTCGLKHCWLETISVISESKLDELFVFETSLFIIICGLDDNDAVNVSVEDVNIIELIGVHGSIVEKDCFTSMRLEGSVFKLLIWSITIKL